MAEEDRKVGENFLGQIYDDWIWIRQIFSGGRSLTLEGLFQLLDLDVFPGGSEGPLVLADAVDLEAEVTLGVGLVDLFVAEVGDEFTVDPSLDVGAFGNDAEVVPLAVLEVLVRDEFFLWGEPSTTGGFAVDVAGFGTFFARGF